MGMRNPLAVILGAVDRDVTGGSRHRWLRGVPVEFNRFGGHAMVRSSEVHRRAGQVNVVRLRSAVGPSAAKRARAPTTANTATRGADHISFLVFLLI